MEAYLHQLSIVLPILKLTHILSFTTRKVKQYFKRPPLELSTNPHLLRSMILQNTTAAPVLTAVARMPAPTIAAGFTLPY